jgi:endogenous inhibitor of DNA gyrase (YacG/DUF329 family)
MSDFVTCPHCGEISNLGGLIGVNTNDCPRCGKPVLGNNMTSMTKTQMVNACANYEVEWFFNQTLEEQKEVYRHLQLHGFEGFKNVPDDNLFESCVHNGTFLMEE